MPVPDFSPGEVLTAAAMDSIGLWLVKSQAILGTPSTVVVSDAFNASFDSYKIVASGVTASGISNVNCVFGAGAANGYYSTRLTNTPNTVAPAGSVGSNNGTNFGFFAQCSANYFNLNCEVINPFLAKRTIVSGTYNLDLAGDSGFGMTHGFINDNTSYTSFTLTAGGGVTLSGGTIRIYGYRN